MRPAHSTGVALPVPSANLPGWLTMSALSASVGIDATNVTRYSTPPVSAALRIASIPVRFGAVMVAVMSGPFVLVRAVVRVASESTLVMAHLLGPADTDDDAPGR